METKITRNEISNRTLRDFSVLSGRQALWLTMILATLLLALVLASSAHASPNVDLVVNNAGDILQDGVCDAAQCTLREAINAANATTGVKETIKFNIPNTPAFCSVGICTITTNSALPFITDPVVIDGYTQPGASANTQVVGNDAALRIRLKPNGAQNGLVIQGGNSQVRGLVFNDYVIAIHLDSNNNTIAGNFIGTNVAGTAAGGKNTVGIYDGGDENVIGGNTAAARNLISGNDVALTLAGRYSKVQGNYIGTNAQGLAAIPNQEGILTQDGHSVLIGGKGKLARNIISGNGETAISLANSVGGYTVQGNLLGVGADGKTALGNESAIYIAGLSSNHLIKANKIANNSNFVVHIANGGVGATNAVITRNSIYNNDDLGIDLGGAGVQMNDADDSDTGPNYLQNFPVVNFAKAANGKTTIKGQLTSRPNETYRIEFFVNPSCNDAAPNDYGEGKKYIGAVTVTTNAQGIAKFKFIKNKIFGTSSYLTTTATHLYQGVPEYTSEFSKCFTIMGN